MRRERAPLITSDIRNFHNLFHAPGTLRVYVYLYPSSRHERSRIAIGTTIHTGYPLQTFASRSPEPVRTGALTPGVPFIN